MSEEELTTIESALKHASQLLSSISSLPHLDAEILLADILKVGRSYLYAHAKNHLTLAQAEVFLNFAMRRSQGEPIAYIVGHKEFWSMNLKVNLHTLIPRPETEMLVELTLKYLANKAENYCVADLGTGSGAIALALAMERKHWTIDAVDVSEQAIAVAQENARQFNLGHVNFLVGDWCAPLTRQNYHAIISNPPYVAIDDPCWKQPEMQYEPKTALVAEQDGLAALEKIILQAKNYLIDGGYLLLEHGWQQAEFLQQCLTRSGYQTVHTVADLAGHPRVTLGQWLR